MAASNQSYNASKAINFVILHFLLNSENLSQLTIAIELTLNHDLHYNYGVNTG